MTSRAIPGLLIAAGIAIIVACTSPSTGGPRLIGDIPIPNVGAADGGTNFGFDISAVDADAGLYYFTDRNNKAVDVIDIKSNKLVAQITGTGANAFAGCRTADGGAIAIGCSGADNPHSGPDGINLITGTNFIYVGDTGNVRIIDKTTRTVTKSILVATNTSTDDTALRADEGCYDPDDHVFMSSSPDQKIPFATFINTDTQQVIARINFSDSAGLEACVYDHATTSFFVNNDGSTANPHGELDSIPASYVTTFTGDKTNGVDLPPAGNGFNRYAEGDCDPTGLDLGPGTDIAISCREGTMGSPLNFLVMNKMNGSIVATINAGGADQIAYDPVTNRYYSAASRWNPTGKVLATGGACSSAAVCTPVVQIIDAASHKVVDQILVGNNAHSIAVSGNDHKFFMPYSSGTSPGGCQDCAAAYPNGGVSVFQTQ